MKFSSSHRTLNAFLKDFALENYGELLVGYKKIILNILHKSIEGSVFGYQFSHDISMLVFDVLVKQNVTFIFSGERNKPLRYSYLLSGAIEHHLTGIQPDYELKSLEGSISSSKLSESQSFTFKANNRIQFFMIELERKKDKLHINNELFSMPLPFQELINDEHCEVSFLYQDNSLIVLADTAQEILNNQYKGFVQSVFLESKALEIVYIQSERYKKDFSGEMRNPKINQYDLDRILKSRELMMANLESSLSITEYAKAIGMSLSKFKRDFKEVFQQTPYKYIMNQKLERSKLLLSDNLYTIKEVANKVGYKSPSRFSKKFKEKFGMYPKDFTKYAYHEAQQRDLKDAI